MTMTMTMTKTIISFPRTLYTIIILFYELFIYYTKYIFIHIIYQSKVIKILSDIIILSSPIFRMMKL